MVVTPDTVVVGVDPYDIDYATFQRILIDGNSPAASEAHGAYETITPHRVSIAFCLAVFEHESRFGTVGIVPAHDLKNPGATRSARTGIGTVVTIPNRGPFVRYPSWVDGWEDLAFRLVDPSFVYVQEGRTTIRRIIERWAPASDNNVPDSYVNAVVNSMNEWIGGTPMPNEPIRLALSAGHHNTDRGGTAGEYERTGPLTREIALRARQVPGLDVRVVQPDDGLGDFGGDLYDAARQVVAWAAHGWHADCFFEVHFEGNGAGDAGRGSFAIYPDWGNDVDVDVRDTIGPGLALKVAALTGVPPRGNGTMSEKHTGVGSQGHRLGVFRATEDFNDITRLIYEFGALTSQADRALINTPGFNAKAAEAVVATLAAFYGLDAKIPPVEPEDALYVPNNPFGKVPIVHGFRGLYERHGALKHADNPLAGAVTLFGFPMAAEYATDYGSAQVFERAIFKFYAGTEPPWDLVIALRSEELPERKAA